MRAVLAAAFFAAASMPVVAQSSVADQVESAYQIYAQSLSTADLNGGLYFDKLVDGIEGKWVLASALLPDVDAERTLETLVEEACAGVVSVEIAVPDRFSITVTRTRATVPWVTTYLYRNGAHFTPFVEPQVLLGYLRLLDDEKRQTALFTMNSALAPVMIFRPSPDVLAVARTLWGTSGLAGIDLYARCASGDTTSSAPTDDGSHSEADLAALDAALGREFDKAFPKVKTGDARASFIACAGNVLRSLKPADLRLLIESNFVVPPDVEDRFEVEYAEVGDQTQACFTAAQSATAR